MEVLHILIRVSTQIQEDDGTSLKTQQENLLFEFPGNIYHRIF